MLPFTINNLDRESFIQLLDYIIEGIGVRTAVYSENSLLPGKIQSAPQPRFDIVLSGIKHLRYPCEGRVIDGMLLEGCVHFNPPNTPKEPCWDTVHAMSSVVIYHDYLRITYISIDTPLEVNAPVGAQCWYHTHVAPNETILQMSRMLTNLTGTPLWNIIACEQILLLLKLVRHEIKYDSVSAVSKKEITWMKLFYYLQDNFTRHITREQIGRELSLCPGYISELITEKTGENFVTLLRRLRMEHAASLLVKTDGKLEEISWLCGYESQTFFCAAFKHHFGITPGAYRNMKRYPDK